MSLWAALFPTKRRRGRPRAGWLVLSAWLGVVVVTATVIDAAEPTVAAEAEDLGAYRSQDLEAARTRLKTTLVAVFAGARHGFVKNQRVPLDPDNWRTEAIVVKGNVLVPERFALRAFGLKRLPWFGLGIAQKKGMVSLADLAAKEKKEVFTDERGLVIVTDEPLTLSDSQLIDSIVALFDTPEKFADPQIAYRNLPSIKAWGKLVNQIKMTDEQVALFDGPETRWRWTPRKAYDSAGLRLQELASKVPPSGEHPRVLFSPDDVPILSSRIRSSVTGSRSLVEMEYLISRSFLDPNTSDGQIFSRLAAGDVDGLAFENHLFVGQVPTLAHTGIAYWPNSLTSMALYCLVTNDDVLGQKTAAAIHDYYKLLEPDIDRLNGRPEVYRTYWHDMKEVVGHMDLALAYDFAAKWMTDEQKALMRRIIAKAVGGRRGYGQNGPVRLRDRSRVTQDLTIFLANLAIEGEDGFDPEVHAVGIDTVKAFLQWGIDSHGLLHEADVAPGAGLEFQLLSMVALARRGESLFGHPHWRRMMEAQAQCTAPDGTLTAARGGGGDRPLSWPILNAFKVFYPTDKRVDYLLGHPGRTSDFDAESYRLKLSENLDQRYLPGPTVPGLTASVLYDADGATAARAELDLPLDFSDSVQGMFSSRSSDREDALWVNMQARPDLYLGSAGGHHDAGAFYLQADGVTWGREGLSPEEAESRHHSIVLIDGQGQDRGLGAGPAKVKYLGAVLEDGGALATADLKYAYDYVWTTQIDSWDQPHAAGYEWELETDRDVVNIFKGTQRYRVCYERAPLSNPWFPTLRAPCNPVRYAFRSIGLVRGAHPYVVCVDDIRKDDESHRYAWQMIGGFHSVTLPGLGAEELVLATKPGPDVKVGDPMLLVREVGPSSCDIENDRAAQRMVVSVDAVDPQFRIVMIPFRMGQALPQTVVDAVTGAVELRWDDQADRLAFEVGGDGRTRLRLTRGKKEILRSK